MILGKDFVWAHMPKTGGNSTATMFDLFDTQITLKDELNKHIKHETFAGRQKRTGVDCTDRIRVMNIRRLANWALSLAQHQHRYSKIEMNIEELANGQVRINNGKGGYKLHHMDSYLKNFMCGRVDKWLRTEHLPSDFIEVMSSFFAIDEDKKNQIISIRENENKRYAKDLLSFFSQKQLETMYEACPVWASLEQKLYGNIIPNTTV